MDQNNLIVYLEFEDGRVADVSLELLTKGRVLASRLGVKLEAIFVGDNLDGVEEQVFPYGVDRLYKVSDKRLYPYTSNPHSAVLINLFREIKPQACLMGATCIGRDLGPRVSSCLHSGLTADCTSLEIGDHTDPKTGKEYKDLLLQIRPAFGGNIVATIVNPECRPQMATVREGVMKKEIFDPAHKGEIVYFNKLNFEDLKEIYNIMKVDNNYIENQHQELPHHCSRRLRSRFKRKFPASPRTRRHTRCRSRSITCCRRCRIYRTCPSDRTDRCDCTPETLYRLWHLRSDPAHRRHAGQFHHHLNQQ